MANPFAKYVQSQDEENPFAKYLQAEEEPVKQKTEKPADNPFAKYVTPTVDSVPNPLADTTPIAVKPAAATPKPAVEAPKKESHWYDFLVENEKAQYDLSRMVGEDVAVAAKNAPVQSAAAVAAAIEGSDPNVVFGEKDWKDSVIKQARQQAKESRNIEGEDMDYLLGIKRSSLRNLPQNLSFSLVSMGAGLSAGLPAFVVGSAATPAVGLGAAYTAGGGASGVAAYRMDTNGFLRDLREHLDQGSIKVTGKPLTDEQFIKLAPSYEKLVKEHGLWEALPEALSNVLGAKIGGAIFKEAAVGLKGLVSTSAKTGAEFLNELSTEAITQTGQHNVEVDAGMSKDKKRSFTSYDDMKKSAEEVLPDVLLLSGTVAGGAKVAGDIKRNYEENTKRGRGNLLGEALEQDIAGRNYTRAGIENAALRNLESGLTPEAAAAREADIGLPIERPVTPEMETATSAAAAASPTVAPPEPPAEETPAAAPAVAKPAAPTVVTEQNFTEMGIGKTNKKLRQEILGKDLSDETQREEVKTALEKFASNPKLTQSIKDNVNGFLSSPAMRGEVPARVEAPVAEAVPAKSKPFPLYYFNEAAATLGLPEDASVEDIFDAIIAQGYTEIQHADGSVTSLTQNQKQETLDEDQIDEGPSYQSIVDPSQRAVELPDPKLKVDNPGGSWLQNNKEDNDKKGKNEFGVPNRFGATTGYLDRVVLVPIDLLAQIPGMRGEQSNVREKDLSSIKSYMKDKNKLPPFNNDDTEHYYPYIQVDQNGKPYVSEGNHRIMAARDLGYKYLPIELKYFTGGESVNGMLSPEKMLEYDRQARSEGYNLTNYGENKTKETAKGKEGVTNSPNFKRWFGNSKVVDENGKPLVVYHSTYSDITTPTVNFGADEYRRFGMHVGSIDAATNRLDVKSAEDARQGEKSGNAGANIMPVYVRAENSLRLNENRSGRWGVDDIMRQIMEKAEKEGIEGITDEDIDAWYNDAFDIEGWLGVTPEVGSNEYNPNQEERFWSETESYYPGERSDLLNAFIRQLGYDSIVYNNEFEGGGDSYILLDPNQVKSATGNSGAYSTTDKRISYDIGRPASEQEKKKRMPSLKLEVERINKAFKNGEITAEQHAEQIRQALDLHNTRVSNKPVKPRSRGADFIRQKLLEAKRRGDISEEAADLAEWFIMQNPALVDDLGISIRQARESESNTAGFYNELARIFTLIKKSSSDTTAVHEILHHMERMMPANVQDAIRSAWKKSLNKAQKRADKGKDANLKMFFELLQNYHFGGNLSSDLQMRAAMKLITDGKVPYSFYQYVNPSEFWAVNATDIVANRYEFSDTVLNRLKNWLREFAEKIKGTFGMTSKAPIIRALDSLMRSDGKFKSSQMLGQADSYDALRQPQNTSQEAQAALDELEQNGMGASPVDPTLAERARSMLNNAVQNPRGTVESARQKFRDWRDFVETRVFSSDAAINNNIRRTMNEMGLDQQEITGALLETSLSQTFHSDAIASNLLMYGKVTYNPELHKWEAKQVDANFVTLAKQLGEFAEKHKLTNEQAQLIAHRAFEARRTFGLMRFDEEIHAEVKSLFNKGNRLAQAAKAEREAGNEANALQLEKDSKEKIREARALSKNRKTIHLTPEQIQLGMDMFKRFPELNKLVDTWNEMRQNAKDMLLEGGLWSEEDAELMLSNMDYVPFYREDELDTKTSPREVLKGLQVQQEKKLTGSLRPVNNIFDNMARWMQYAANRSVRNRSAQALVDTAVELNLAEKVSDTKGHPNTIKVWREGKEEIYSLQDPMFVEAFKGMESVAIPLVKTFAKFSNMLRDTVVLNPLFTIAQVPQDAYDAMFSSGLKPQYALRIPALAAKEFAKTLFKMSKTHEELRKFGAVGVKDFSSAVARLDAEVAAGLKAPPGVMGKVKSALQHFAMAGDNAMRQAVYEASLQAGKTQAESLEKAFDLINFRRNGSSRTLAIAGQVIPFFRAYLAAQSVAYKVITGRGISPSERADALKTFIAMNAATMALSVIYTMLNGDDEDYLKKPATVRDRLLMIPGTGGLSIPLRKSWFTMSKVLAEHTYLLLTDKGYEDGRKFRDSVKSMIVSSILSPTAVPQAIKPIVEVSFNHDFFQDTPLIPQHMLNMETERQFNDNTSELGKLAGKTGMVAPVNFDHLVRGMFGSLGGLSLYMTNFMLHSDPNVSRPELSFREVMTNLPGTSGFVSRPFENALRSDFYVLREEVTKSANTLRDIEKRSPHLIDRVIDDEQFLERAGMEKGVNRIAKELTSIRNQISAITNAPDSDYSAKEKAELIKELRDAESEMLKEVDVKELRKMAHL